MKSTGYISNGKYYRTPAKGHLEPDSSTYKSWSHDRQRENHRRELIQPYVNNKPNPEFIQEYPAESQEYGFL